MEVTKSTSHAQRGRSAFDPAEAAHRVACRLFPGFERLPTPVLVSLEPYAALFDADGDVLELADREAIAAAVAELAAGASRGTSANAAPGSVRPCALARFAIELLSDSFAIAIDGAGLERLVRAGFTRDEIAAAAEAAIGYHVVARLVAASHGRRPAICETLTKARARAAFAA